MSGDTIGVNIFSVFKGKKKKFKYAKNVLKPREKVGGGVRGLKLQKMEKSKLSPLVSRLTILSISKYLISAVLNPAK